MTKDICEGMTFVMPTRIDSDTRKRNLLYVVNRLSKIGCKIIILEADKSAKLSQKDLDFPCVEYHFVKDNNLCFFRTHYINVLLKMAVTEVVAVWDTDIVTSYEQIQEAYEYIIDENFVMTYPYCGKYVMLGEEDTGRMIAESNLIMFDKKNLHSVFNRPFCGGAYLINRIVYLSIGGENERFNGWGPEDVERQKRVEILGLRFRWTKTGNAYHLNHPRKKNSYFFSKVHKCKIEQELVNVCSMDKKELIEYIKTW